MINRELHISENIENEIGFLRERVMMSSKGSPSEVEGNMDSLIGLVCFMLPTIIGMVDGLDPCLN